MGARGRLLVLPPPMARRSLKPQLNRIRAWVREGRTNAWIAHQLDVSAKDIDSFKRNHGLAPEGEGEAAREEEGLDLRAEDEALIAAELEAEPEDEEEGPYEEEGEEDLADDELAEALEEGGEPADDGDGDGQARRRRRGRRGGRRRRRRKALEGTFDHGEEGYGLWLDPAVKDDPVYAEHWAGHRAVSVTVEAEQIVIRRSGGDEG